MDAAELARWTRFAAKGGIGTCTATQDCVAQREQDLMFMTNDDITVLMQLPDREGVYLGYCEGVVGHFQGSDVRFRSKLKKPVMTKRSSTASTKSLPPMSPSPVSTSTSLPRPISQSSVSAPSRSLGSHSAIVQTSTQSKQLEFAISHSHATVAPSSGIHSHPRTFSSPPPMLPEDHRIPSSDDGTQAATTPASLEVTTRHIPVETHHVNTLNEPLLHAEIVSNTAVLPNDDSPPEEDVILLRPTSFLQESSAIPFESRHSDSHFSTQETFSDHHSTRLSAAISDGEVGIGISLLQDVANEDDWSSTHSSRSNSRSLDDHWVLPPSPKPLEGDTSSVLVKPQPGGSTVEYVRDSSSPEPTVRAQPGHSEDDWEGASDIYDDYRYSRQSTASKASRYSLNSSPGTLTTHATPEVPPVPSDPRPSGEVRRSIDSLNTRPLGHSKASGTFSVTSRSSHLPPPDLALQEKDRLVPFDALHDNLYTPPTSSSFAITPAQTPSSSSPKWAGAASALRQRLAKTHHLHASHYFTQEPSQKDGEEDASGSGCIVIEDDEIVMARQSSSRPTSPVILAPHSVTESAPPSPRLLSPSISSVSSQDHIQHRSQAPPPITIVQSEQMPTQPLLQPECQSPPQIRSEPQPLQSQSSRPADSAAPGQESSRLSLFLPHPNAPKPTTSSFGPMYARRSPPQQYQYPGSSASATNSAVNVIHMAVTSQYGPNSMVRPTIYGQCDFDLMTSMGPVPISFSLDPPKSIRVPQSAPRPSVTTSTISPRDTSGSNVTEWPASVDNSTDRSPTPSSPIPRANFFPKAQTTRPRSRSFSEFNKSSTGNSLALERSLEEGSKPRTASISKAPLARAASASVTVLSSQNSLILQTPNVSSRQLRASSPLSLSQNNNAAVLRTGKSPTNLYPLPPSPLSQDARAFSDTNDAASSSPTIVDPRLSKPPPEGINCTTPSPIQRYFPSSDSRASLSNFRGDTRDPSLKELRPRRSVDGNLSHLNDIRSQVSTPLSTIPLVRNTSLRSKMSLPTLRGRAGFKNSKDDSSSIVSSPQVIEPGPDNETMQVQDMDFELIRPVISHVSESSSTQPSGDSGLLSHSASPEIKLEFSAGLLRADSPTVSMLSGLASGERSPTTLDDASRPRTPKPFELESSIDAHRQRELRWVSLMSSIPPAQIRKNKRVKKLLVEGVPSSVRYLVWAHLTNSKSRGVTGVYSQLGKRGKVPASGEIERDVQQCFLDQPQLRSTDGPLCSLLQAYLTMVPDIRYHIGLTYIAGHLLLLSPEEDAFWIFVSMMDTHLRPYFSSSTIQMEVDSALFSRALEATDAPLAKKIFVQMGISPITICRPWLSSLFAETLPFDYLHRVWDLFLYEGMSVPFLLRVALAICSICRRGLLESKDERTLLDHLFHPPSNSLPTVDAFLSLTLSVKLKDDEVRKQRVKMEAQVKRQTQTRAVSTSGIRVRTPSVSLPRS